MELKFLELLLCNFSWSSLKIWIWYKYEYDSSPEHFDPSDITDIDNVAMENNTQKKEKLLILIIWVIT